MPDLTMGSLFDGIGGFPLAAVRNGITPLWASEIEPFPIEVTKTHFPDMHHVGKVRFCDFDGKRFDLRRPQGRDSVTYHCQRKAADAVKQAAHCEFTHAAAAFATVFVILIAVCAV